MSTPATDAAALSPGDFARKYGGPVGLEARLQIGSATDWGRAVPPDALPAGKTAVVFTYGQSNALGDVNTINSNLVNLAGTNYRLTDGVTPNVRFNIDLGGAAAFPTGIVAFAESQQSGYGGTCLTGFLLKTGTQGAICMAGGKGATTLDNLVPGTTPWTRLQQNLDSVKMLGYDTVEAAMLFWQGENDNIATTKDDYKIYFDDMLAELSFRVKDPLIIGVAVSGCVDLGTDTMGASLALYELFLTERIELAGPAYGLPFVSGNLHPTHIGQIIMGEMMGRVWNQRQKGIRYKPVHPTTVEWDSRYSPGGLRVDFHVPAGGVLRCDALNHQAVTGLGFRFLDADGTTFVEATVQRVVGNSVYMEPEESLSPGTCKLRYALDYKAHASHAAQGAGNCFADSGEMSAVAPSVPLLHWCIPFQIEFTTPA